MEREPNNCNEADVIVKLPDSDTDAFNYLVSGSHIYIMLMFL